MQKRSIILVVLTVFLGLYEADRIAAQTKKIQFNANLELPLTADHVQNGWISLFDGDSLFGWRNESTANWRVENGLICVDSGGIGLLRTTSQFDDFQLFLEYRAEASTNSGVFIRTSPRPKNPASDCYEINIAPPENPYPTGSIVARSKADQTTGQQRFNTLEIQASGNEIRVQVNGRMVCQYRDDRPLGRGYIGLQHNSGGICFRNIRLRPLNAQTLLDSEGLENWIADPQRPELFQLDADGDLVVAGGPGRLESRARFGDFVLQLQANIALNQNSGVFFRCVPGENLNGYESQIHNGFRDGDRTKPTDAGTGAIFRRQPARRVVADDEQWFAKTIVACGPHISVWVNGFQVVDWTDGRPSHDNPRRGKRLEPGTIMLQAHDPQTQIKFRGIRARELTRRGR